MERLARDEKLREVSVSSLFLVDNYAIPKKSAEKILMNKYRTKAS